MVCELKPPQVETQTARLTQNTRLRKRRTVLDVKIPQSMLRGGKMRWSKEDCGAARVRFLCHGAAVCLSVCLSVCRPVCLSAPAAAAAADLVTSSLSAAALSSRSHASGRRAMEQSRSEQLLRHTPTLPLLGADTSLCVMIKGALCIFSFFLREEIQS